MRKVFEIILLSLLIFSFVATSSAEQNGEVDLTEGLVAYYPFNGNADDESGNGNDGTANGALLTEDRFGNANSAYNFDGVDNYLNFGNNDSLNITEAISLIAWIYPRSLEKGRIISKWGYHSGYELDVVSDEIRFNLNQYVQATSSISGMENQWIFVSATWDGNIVKLYINNSLVDSSDYAESLVTSPNNLLIGEMANFAPIGYFNGILDDLRIYNRALSESEIQQLYNGQESDESTGGTDVEAFVTRFYQQCLGREPDSAGLDGWVNGLLDGSLSGSDVANSFIFSAEFVNRNTSNGEFITILYRAFFGRGPDSVGYNGWISALNAGVSREDALNGFTGSQEFYDLCAGYGITPTSDDPVDPDDPVTPGDDDDDSDIPISKDECKKGGWQGLVRFDGSSFKNQGDCIQYVNTGQ